MSFSNLVLYKDQKNIIPGLTKLQSYLLSELNLNPEMQESFLDAELFNIPSPYLLPNMVEAVSRVKKAVENKEIIYLFGDNDVDGLSSIAVLNSFLLDYLPEENLILDHTTKEDSYGLSGLVVDRILAKKPNLLIALDCGTSNEEEIKLLQAEGIDVLILDHHSIPEGDDAGILVNPRLVKSKYPQNEIATVGLVSLFVFAYHLSLTSFYNTAYFFLTQESDVLSGALYFRGERIFEGSILDLNGSKYSSKVNEHVSEFKEIYFIYFSSNNDTELKKRIHEVYNKPCKLQSLQSLLYNKANVIKPEYTVLRNIIIKPAYSDYDLYRLFFQIYLHYRPKMMEEFLSCLDLCAIGTITDMVPLTGVNRIFVRKGLSILAYSKRPGLEALRNLLQIDSKDLSSFHLGWEFGPALNAPGRMSKANESLALMLCRDKQKSMQLALNVVELNKERKNITKENLELMTFRIKDSKLDTEQSIIIYDESFKPGVTGLVASRISEKFSKPTVLLGPVNDIVKGSVRTVTKHNLVELLSPFSDLLLEYGGHPGAAGFTLTKENLDSFIEKWKEKYQKLPNESNDEEQVLLLDLNDITKEFMKELLFLEPFGNGNREPSFCIENILPQSFRFMGKDNLHGKFQANGKKGMPVDFVLWQKAKEFSTFLNGHDKLSVVGKLAYNIYRGRRTIQFVISDYQENKFNLI